MSDAVKPQMHGRDHRPGGSDPIPGLTNPWIRLHNGSITIAHNTSLPVPADELQYDPALVTQGDIFDWEITDDGNPGNDRFQLKTLVEGFYYYSLTTVWDQVNTNGTEDFAYFQQKLLLRNTSDTTTFYDNRSSADWLRDDFTTTHGASDAPGEQYANPYLTLTDTLYTAGTRVWKPTAIQSTGSSRGLGADLGLFVMFIQNTDASTWTTESV